MTSQVRNLRCRSIVQVGLCGTGNVKMASCQIDHYRNGILLVKHFPEPNENVCICVLFI